MSNQQGISVHHMYSEEGQRILNQQKLTAQALAKAIAEYQRTEQVHVGAAIGLHELHGFFFSERDDWAPADLAALTETLVVIPWSHIHELLGNVPEGSSAGLGFSNPN
ncbi:MAG: hypothetical protein ACK5R4_01770 [Alphaproteobacteria bacterium]